MEFIDAAVNDHERAKRLLEQRPDLVDSRYIHGESVLHFLSIEGYSGAVEFLVAAGASVNSTDRFGDTPLISAATLGEEAVAEVLLRAGANPNAISETWSNPLHAAASNGHIGVMRLLLDAGARADYKDELEQTIWTAIDASRGDREAIVEMLALRGICRPTTS